VGHNPLPGVYIANIILLGSAHPRDGNVMDSNEWESEFYNEFGLRVRNARGRAGMTQADLASRLHLTRSSVANLESGRQRIQIHLLVLLAEALDVSMEEVLPEVDRSVSETTGGGLLNEIDMNGIPDASRRFLADALRVAPNRVDDGAA
jgi:transcriptional regulator with XRE-family HTH domain